MIITVVYVALVIMMTACTYLFVDLMVDLYRRLQ